MGLLNLPNSVNRNVSRSVNNYLGSQRSIGYEDMNNARIQQCAPIPNTWCTPVQPHINNNLRNRYGGELNLEQKDVWKQNTSLVGRK